MSNPGPASSGLPTVLAVMATDNTPTGAAGTFPQQNLGDQAVRILGQLRGLNLSSTVTQVIPIVNSAKYNVKFVTFCNAVTSTGASANLSAGASISQFVDTSLSTGNAIISNSTTLSTLTSSSVLISPTISAAAALVTTAQNLYIQVGTTFAAFVDVYVHGLDLT